jgi:preprotein translocase subunit SecY
MLASVLAAFRVPDLKKRIMFVMAMFFVFVLGLHIPVAISREAAEKLKDLPGLLGLLDAFTGGAMRKLSIFAIGITPYINASIIMQLLTIAVPQIEQLAKEGEPGQKKIRLWTRWMTGVLAIVQAVGMIAYIKNLGVPIAGFQNIQIVITLAAGTAFLMWIGELITDKGIGNGVSMVIFAGIVASLPTQIGYVYKLYSAHTIGPLNVIGLVIAFLLTVMAIVAVSQAQRKIPIQHVKRVVGNKMYGGQSSFLPLKVNSAGVIPIIFAVSLQYLPLTLAQFLPNKTTGLGKFVSNLSTWLTPGLGVDHLFGTFLYAALVIFFTYFYTAVTFNVPEVADNLKKWGSFIPGIRPGKPTMEYLDKVMTRITLAGAIFLALIALAQYIVPDLVGVGRGGSSQFRLVGGTSLLIVVGVALETMQAIEAQLLMRHYEGFIK